MQQGCVYVVRDTHPQLDNSSSSFKCLYSQGGEENLRLYIYTMALQNITITTINI